MESEIESSVFDLNPGSSTSPDIASVKYSYFMLGFGCVYKI